MPLFVAIMVLALATSAVAAAPLPSYQLQRLPAPEGCRAYAGWHGLNDDGEAALVVACEGAPETRAVVWSPAAVVPPRSLGGPVVTPYGTHRDGLVVGASETLEAYGTEGFVTRPVIWEDGVPCELGTLGGPLGGALSMNARGMIVGACQPEHIDPWLGRRPMRACAWTGGVARDLGDLGGREAAAYDINDRGWIAGSSMTRVPSRDWFEEHAFLLVGQKMRDLGTLGGPVSFAWAVNDRGEVVGMSHTGDRLSFHAFAWRRNVLRDLGTLGGTMSEAIDVNDDGWIVGWSRTAESGAASDHGVLWIDDAPIDLNDRLIDPKGCVVVRALSINRHGSILGDARCYDGDHAVVLEPE